MSGADCPHDRIHVSGGGGGTCDDCGAIMDPSPEFEGGLTLTLTRTAAQRLAARLGYPDAETPGDVRAVLHGVLSEFEADPAGPGEVALETRARARLEAEGGYVARWRHRLTDPDRIALHATRPDAHEARAAAGGGLVERLPRPVEVEAPPALGLRPCDGCPTGWLRAVAGDAGPDLLCPTCGREARLRRMEDAP